MSKHQVGYIAFGLFTLFYFFAFYFWNWPIIVYIGFFVLWILVVIYGSFIIQLNYHVKSICSVKSKEKVVAITFDDGPTEFTTKILDLLDEYQQKATFFCIGKQIEKHNEILSEIVKRQHEVGNHTYSHQKSMGFKSTKNMVKEIQDNAKLIEEKVGVKDVYFRPPFGVTNPRIRRAVKKLNQTVIGWNIRSFDTVNHDEEMIFKRIKRRISPGSIILLHDTSDKTVNVVRSLLEYLKKEKYKSVTIHELLNLK